MKIKTGFKSNQRQAPDGQNSGKKGEKGDFIGHGEGYFLYIMMNISSF